MVTGLLWNGEDRISVRASVVFGRSRSVLVVGLNVVFDASVSGSVEHTPWGMA